MTSADSLHETYLYWLEHETVISWMKSVVGNGHIYVQYCFKGRRRRLQRLGNCYGSEINRCCWINQMAPPSSLMLPYDNSEVFLMITTLHRLMAVRYSTVSKSIWFMVLSGPATRRQAAAPPNMKRPRAELPLAKKRVVSHVCTVPTRRKFEIESRVKERGGEQFIWKLEQERRRKKLETTPDFEEFEKHAANTQVKYLVPLEYWYETAHGESGNVSAKDSQYLHRSMKVHGR